MKNVLYIGNALSNKGKTITTIETLTYHLKEFYSVYVASNKNNKFLRLIDMIRLVILKGKQSDVVLIDTYSTSNFYYALIISQICRILKLKYIPILHGGNLEKRLKNSSYFSQLIFNNAYKMVAPSRFLKTVFENYGYTNIVHIPNTIDIDNYEYSVRDINTLRLLWVRSFSKIYNPELAVYVLEDLINKGYSTELTMIGPDVDGSLAVVKNLAKEKSLNVTFTGKLSKKEWIKLSKQHNIFINTTNFDNTPVSLIEAMALGLPIISTDVGGLPYLITHNEEGLLVPANDTNAMVRAILKVMSNKNLKEKLVKDARKKAELFDWNNVSHQWKMVLS